MTTSDVRHAWLVALSRTVGWLLTYEYRHRKIRARLLFGNQRPIQRRS